MWVTNGVVILGNVKRLVQVIVSNLPTSLRVSNYFVLGKLPCEYASFVSHAGRLVLGRQTKRGGHVRLPPPFVIGIIALAKRP